MKCPECGVAFIVFSTETLPRHEFTCSKVAQSIQTYRWAGWTDEQIRAFLPDFDRRQWNGTEWVKS